MVDPSTAMFFAAAEVKLTAPCTLWMTWLLLAELSEFDLVSLDARLADVEDALVSVSLLLWVVEELWAVFVALALAELEDSEFCEALFSDSDDARCELLEAAVFRLAFSDAAAFADELLFDEAFSVSADWLALFAVFEAVLELPPVALVDVPLLVVERLSAPLPTVDDVAPRLVPLLLFDELPIDEALPGLVEAAVAVVALEAAVLLLVLPLFAAALSVSEADFTLLAVFALFADTASVAPKDLVELFAAEFVSVDPELLLALSVWALFLDALVLKVDDLLVVKLSVLVSLLLFVWLNEVLREWEELFVSVSFCEWVASSWLFAPRL
jgi:hypothetical protein